MSDSTKITHTKSPLSKSNQLKVEITGTPTTKSSAIVGEVIPVKKPSDRYECYLGVDLGEESYVGIAILDLESGLITLHTYATPHAISSIGKINKTGTMKRLKG